MQVVRQDHKKDNNMSIKTVHVPYGNNEVLMVIRTYGDKEVRVTGKQLKELQNDFRKDDI